MVNYYWNLFQISSDFFCTTVARRRSLSNLIETYERRVFGAGVYGMHHLKTKALDGKVDPAVYSFNYFSVQFRLALQAQRFSVALHIASAWEIATEMQLAGGGGEAPSSDEEGAATA